MTRQRALWASTTVPKVQLESADGDGAESVRARLRERVSSPCGDLGWRRRACLPPAGWGWLRRSQSFVPLHFFEVFLKSIESHKSGCECVAACALAPLGLRIISPLTFYLRFLGAIWTYDKNLAPIFPSHLSTTAPQIFPDSRPPSQRKYM